MLHPRASFRLGSGAASPPNRSNGTPVCGVLLFFFFQAEDGIRDLTVTGVQTCALPIYALANLSTRVQVGTAGNVAIAGFIITGNATKQLVVRGLGPSLAMASVPGALSEIGRASCRGRV